MDIKDFLKKQEEFDNQYKFLKHWNEKISENNLEVLNFLLLSASGEIGEASNIAKKILRGDFTLKEKKSDLNEEITDAFIYIIKLINQLDIDIEKEYNLKMQKNAIKFGARNDE